MPNGLVRWGISVIFFVMLTFFAASWFIKYPDILTAEVVVTTEPAPISLVARTAGRLSLVRSDGAMCGQGDLIAFIQSNASVEDVIRLENLMRGELPADETFAVGDLQPALSALMRAENDVRLFKQNAVFDRQIEQLKRQWGTYQRLARSLKNQQVLAQQEGLLAKQRFGIDSLLYAQKVTATIDFNQAKATWLQQQRSMRNLETSLFNNELQIHQLEKQIGDLELQKQEQSQQQALAVANARQELAGQIKRWRDQYLIVAPASGIISYLAFLESNVHVEAGKPLVALLPENENIIARAELPLAGSGKVKVGQRVNIKLAN